MATHGTNARIKNLPSWLMFSSLYITNKRRGGGGMSIELACRLGLLGTQMDRQSCFPILQKHAKKAFKWTTKNKEPWLIGQQIFIYYLEISIYQNCNCLASSEKKSNYLFPWHTDRNASSNVKSTAHTSCALSRNNPNMGEFGGGGGWKKY